VREGRVHKKKLRKSNSLMEKAVKRTQLYLPALEEIEFPRVRLSWEEI
jgi:hypothetical protein